jgi:hypothetical protein
MFEFRPVLLAGAAAAILQAPISLAQGDWQSSYTVGTPVEFTISGNQSDFQPCTVAENWPGGIMKVECGSFRQWSAGKYIVYNSSDIRKAGGGSQAAQPQPPQSRQAAQFAADDWQSAYQVGDQVNFSISGSETEFQPCTIAENWPGGIMKVNCGSFRQWVAGRYIVYGPSYLRKGGAGGPATQPGDDPVQPVQAPPEPAPEPTPGPQPAQLGLAGDIPLGSYECWGWNSARMDLNFILDGGGRYTDSDGALGSYAFDAGSGQVSFSGGALDGQLATFEMAGRIPTVRFPTRDGTQRTGDFCEFAG